MHKTKTNHAETDDHKVDIFMPIFIGDYLKDTTFLTTEQHGAYLLMLFACWQHGAIPDNDRVICRTTGLSQQAWDDAKIVILPYFKIIDGKLRHSRIDRELAAAKQKKANFSERGKKGNDARWKSNKESNKESFKDATSNPLATKEGIPNLSPLPSPSIEDNIIEQSGYSVEYRMFYEKYPRKGKMKDGWDEYKKLTVSNDVLLRSVENHTKTDEWRKENGKYIPSVSNFLKNQCWTKLFHDNDEQWVWSGIGFGGSGINSDNQTNSEWIIRKWNGLTNEAWNKLTTGDRLKLKKEYHEHLDNGGAPYVCSN